ncbi:peptide chain release factor 1 [Aquidulcibacter sp.]|jgi:peptide chain release factor 1|uniref:peptide chain release factor 1 n=1 Tax=Aquidulcibacter sp. TaxID=2052990 RepID=UPI0022C2E27E|nr:peptide chain release factor 1 [Aquidulcibacter sp.]MCE2889597.1 peptide chain release factor 1 [Hyphomonadaceae bacterium]MCZ8209201.1 peptide chain release factor 1 [Aquidulcibacter sp.]
MRLTQDRLFRVLDRFDEIDARLSVCSDGGEIMRLSKERSSLAPVADAIRSLEKARAERVELEQMILDLPNNDEMAQMAQAELEILRESIPTMEQGLQILLLPKDADDEADVILEVRAGTGGDEAALFAGDLFRMYQRYAATRGWRVEVESVSDGEMGGYKEIIASVSGEGAFGRMKFESGVHRVQRVPVTEAGGRIHTSAATVAVLPAREDVEIEIHEKDIRIDTYRSSGAGGQHVNKTDSAVRLTHIPSGIVVTSSEKSQHQNRANAMRTLKARLYEQQRAALAAERSASRQSQVGSGDRSERIRTYNFPQGRVTDHRINLTLYKLDTLLEGSGLEEMVEALIADDTARRLAEADD